jgi:homoserine kinase
MVLGGFCIGAPGRGFERVEMDAREYLVIVPELEIRTSDARAALPASIPFPDAIFNLQRAALTAVRIARAGHLGAALPFEDVLHQRYRLALDPRLEAAFGALASLPRLEGAFLSGSGSTVIALPQPDAVESAQLDCAQAFRQCGLEVAVHRLAADNTGLQLEAL